MLHRAHRRRPAGAAGAGTARLLLLLHDRHDEPILQNQALGRNHQARLLHRELSSHLLLLMLCKRRPLPLRGKRKRLRFTSAPSCHHAKRGSQPSDSRKCPKPRHNTQIQVPQPLFADFLQYRAPNRYHCNVSFQLTCNAEKVEDRLMR